jgi:hypothetical protein
MARHSYEIARDFRHNGERKLKGGTVTLQEEDAAVLIARGTLKEREVVKPKVPDSK